MNRLMDPDSVTDAQIALRKKNAQLVDDLQVLLDTNSHMTVRLETCRDEVEKSNDGEDVAPADGLSGVVPY